MNARELRHKVIIQSPTGTQNALGERTTTWSDVATVQAKVEPVTSRERFVAVQTVGEISHRVTVRYSSTIIGIESGWRVKYGSRILVVDGPPRNLGERNRYLEILCNEGLTTE